jgi:signal transduction histidine kinase
MDHDKIRALSLIFNDAAKNGFAILENLLDWSRSQTGLLKYAPEKIDLKKLIDEHILNIYHSSRNKDIEIFSKINPDMYIFADQYMIKTILRNLLSNAVKFTLRRGQIIVDALEKDDKVIISIKDNGTGISPENIAKIFRIDSKFSLPGTENEVGTGLGLKLCKEFVEKQGGKIWVESVENEGSDFRFSIPFNRGFIRN